MQAFLIDASIYIFRSYFTLPDNWRAQESGFPTQAVYGFTNFLLDLLRQKQPDFIACAFDESLGSGFRHAMSAEYKSNRELPNDALAFQLNACRQLCRVFGITEIASSTYEADDLIGGMVKIAIDCNIQPVIVSRDKDLMQLVHENVLYWDFGKYQPQTQARLEKKLEICCNQIPDFLALMGDASDNIAGLPGVGSKTAKQLLSYFPDIDSMLEHLDQLQDLPIRGAKKLADKFVVGRDQLILSRELATIIREIEDMPSSDNLRWRGIQAQAFELFADEMGFGSVFSSRISELKHRPFVPGLSPQE